MKTEEKKTVCFGDLSPTCQVGIVGGVIWVAIMALAFCAGFISAFV